MVSPRNLEHPTAEEMSLDLVLSALADPIRRTIVAQLSCGHEDQRCIAFALPVSKSTTTHHFRVLREAGVISQHYRGTSILNNLRTADLNLRFPGLLDAVLGAAAD
ncbi:MULTISPECIES: ArsR/SmtB family transcription factor [Arthrobacter]|uniref:ArsR/SmtB family transcription factor n=1 Tax=unclassified Arthrobacter TaxID=235627 RepID=UPI0024BAAADA|nr:ArsR family transcriptional regulator [Arthrobacter sp. H35-MC1]MDJ0316759.1 helix-turn-helix domain-containing protein [Arthrobacter sp. H35-MC1]